MDKYSGIYCIINKVNNKRYIGCAVDLDRRIKFHPYDIKALELRGLNARINFPNWPSLYK